MLLGSSCWEGSTHSFNEDSTCVDKIFRYRNKVFFIVIGNVAILLTIRGDPLEDRPVVNSFVCEIPNVEMGVEELDGFTEWIVLVPEALEF